MIENLPRKEMDEEKDFIWKYPRSYKKNLATHTSDGNSHPIIKNLLSNSKNVFNVFYEPGASVF